MPTAPFEVLTESQLRARASLKWQHHGPDVLPLWVAEMDVLPAPEVVQALTAAVRGGDTGYPRSTPAYAEAFAGFAQQRWGWAPDPSLMTTCADVMTGIRVLVEALVPPGGPVVIPSPVYPPFAGFTRELGRRVVPVPLTERGRLDVPAIGAQLARLLAEGAPPAAILLCSPHNPTGAVHTRAELAALAEAAGEHGATVISDEVHGPLARPDVTFIPWHAVADSGFVVTSAAKAFNLAGLKAALVVAAPSARRQLRALPESVRYGASHLGVIGHAAGYRSDPAWLDAVNANIAANQALLADLLAVHLPQVPHRVPEATYLAWLDLRGLGLGDDPADALLVRGGVALNPGPTFGPGGAGHARVNVACPAAVLTGAVARIAAVAGPTQG
jgi:cystathionine beta-lyase